MISEYLSKKLHFLSAFLLLFVIMSHSFNIGTRITNIVPSEINLAIQSIMSYGFCLIAVPVYFMASGLFFFKGQNQYPLSSYRKKLSGRVNSLLIPYLLTSGIVILFFYAIQSIPAIKPLFNNELITDKSFGELIESWLLYPRAYHLWYIRNLIVVTIISPLIFLLIKRGGLFYLIPVIILWIFFSTDIPFHIPRTLAMFSIGAFISIKGIKLGIHKNKTLLIAISSLWVVLACLQYFCFAKDTLYQLVFVNISILIGVVAIWLIYDYFYEPISKSFGFFEKYIYPFSFFIFLFHEPVLTIVIKLMILMFGSSNPASLTIYFIAPVFTFLICWFIAVFAKRYLTYFYRLVTGSRNK